MNRIDPSGQFPWAIVAMFTMAGTAPVLVSNSDDWGGHAAMVLAGTTAADAAALGAMAIARVRVMGPFFRQLLADPGGAVNLGRILGGGGKGPTEIVIRYGSEAEAIVTKEARGLVPRPGHVGPKRVAEAGARIKPKNLGRRKSYSHLIEIEVEPGTTNWLRQWPIEGEPGRYAIPSSELGTFNSLIRGLRIVRVR